MTIDLELAEIEILQKALKAWETEPTATASSNGLFAGVLGMVTGASEEKTHAMIDKKTNEAKTESTHREETAVILRAKLLMAVKAHANLTRSTAASS